MLNKNADRAYIKLRKKKNSNPKCVSKNISAVKIKFATYLYFVNKLYFFVKKYFV